MTTSREESFMFPKKGMKVPSCSVEGASFYFCFFNDIHRASKKAEC